MARFRNTSRPVSPDVFVDARSKGRGKFVEACLKVGQDPDIATRNGYTALQAAAANNQVNLLRLLLTHGADINVHSTGRALVAAASRACMDSFKLLLDAGARIDLGTPLFAASHGFSPHEIRTRSFMVRARLAAGCDPNGASPEGRIPLIATDGEVELVQPLLEAGANVNAKSSLGWTVLEHVVFLYKKTPSRSAGVQLIVRAGADVRANSRYESVLSNVVRSGDAELVKVLLDAGAVVNDPLCPPAYQFSDLCRAARSGSVETVRLILHAGGSVNEREPQSGGTPLQSAAASGNVEVVKLLLAAGASVFERDTVGRDALFFAAKFGQDCVLELLLELGVDPNAGESVGISPLRAAVATGRVHCVELLLAAGANINARSRSELTALQLAENFRRTKIQELLKNHAAKHL